MAVLVVTLMPTYVAVAFVFYFINAYSPPPMRYVIMAKVYVQYVHLHGVYTSEMLSIVGKQERTHWSLMLNVSIE